MTGPLIGTDRRFGEGAAEKLVSDLQTSVVTAGREKLPVTADAVAPSLLQIACSQLWENLPAGRTEITSADVRRYADVDTALAAHVGSVVVATAEDHDLAPTRLRSWLVDTFVTEHGRRRTEYEGLTTTAGLPNAVVWTLVDRHLLSAEVREGAWWHTLLSDRLIEPLLASPAKPLAPVRSGQYLRAAERALTTGELDLAEQYAGLAERATPPSSLRLLGQIASLRGNLACEREKPADAEAQYRRAARMFEAVRDTPAVAYQLAAVGQVLLAQGRIPEAVAELHSAVNRMPNDPVLQTELARALWQLGDGQAAVAILTGALEVDGHNLAALRTRGEVLADLGDARAALRDLDRVSLAGHPAARAARGLALAELDDQPTASHEIETAVSDSPRNGRVLLYAARVAELDGDQAAAEELARRAVDAVDPALSAPHRTAALKLAGEIAGRRPRLRFSRLPPASS